MLWAPCEIKKLNAIKAYGDNHTTRSPGPLFIPKQIKTSPSFNGHRSNLMVTEPPSGKTAVRNWLSGGFGEIEPI